MSPFKIKTLQFFFCYLFCFVAISSSFSQAEHYSYEHYISKSKDTLRYRLLWPDANTDKKKFPLVIFLHGSGERGTDNQGQLKWGALNFAEDKMMLAHPAIVIAPQCPPEELWSNLRDGKNVFDLVLLPTPSRPTRILLEMIDSLKNRMPVDTNRIYITGLSMGGYGVYDIIERRPGLFAAAVPVCGGGGHFKSQGYSPHPDVDISRCGRPGGSAGVFDEHGESVDRGRRTSRVYAISRSRPFFVARGLYRSADV
jgi:predicted peptidase